MTEVCTKTPCIPRPHIHTDRIEEMELKEYWCPAKHRWMDCPGPCPDGREHTFFRRRTVMCGVVELIKEE